MNGMGTATGAALRGVVAAMAMSGLRTVTTGLGLLERTPPQAVVREGGGSFVEGLSDEQRAVVTELAHWGFGGAAGAAFTLVPAQVRREAWSGPAYGLGIWLVFELAVAPFLGVRHAEQRRVSGRAMVALDHLLYGALLAGRPAPTRP